MAISSAIADTGKAAVARPEPCFWEDFGRLDYGPAWELQTRLVEQRKAGEAGDHLLFVEHSPVITLGRNARRENLLLSPEELRGRGIEVWETDRGGDVTYHGPGQIVGYPIVDLKQWKRDVLAYVRALEQVLIEAIADFGIEADREPGCTGVWAGEAKLAAIGVHLSRWVTSHGFALNHTTEMRYFRYIVPCGLSRPVTSMEALLGEAPPREEVVRAIVQRFGEIFGRKMLPAGG